MDEYVKKLDAFQAKNEFLNPCVIKNTNEETEYARAYAKGWNDCNSSFIDNIDKIPAADVQEVIYCKDCKNYCKFENGAVVCEEFGGYIKDTDFCSRGERKDGE